MILKNKKGSQEMSTSTPARSIRSAAELRLESVTMTIESGSRREKEGLFQAEADGEREERDSD